MTRPRRASGIAATGVLLATLAPLAAPPGAAAASGVAVELVVDGGIHLGGALGDLTPFDGGALFAAELGGDRELWFTDGTSAGTHQVANLRSSGSSSPGGFAVRGNLVFFTAADEAGVRQLWRTDGTAGGTDKLTDLQGVSLVTILDTTTLFVADDGDGQRLWAQEGAGVPHEVQTEVVDGDGQLIDTAEAPFIEMVASADGSYAVLRAGGHRVADLGFGDETYDHGEEVWRTDGTNGGTFLLTKASAPEEDILFGVAGSNPLHFTPLESDIYFGASDGPGVNGQELWRTDGQQAFLVADINAGGAGASSHPNDLTDHGRVLVFVADDGTHGREPWRHVPGDGTTMIADIATGADDGIFDPWTTYIGGPSDLSVLVADDGSGDGEELWATNGSSAALVEDIWPGAESSVPWGGPDPKRFGVFDGRAWFAANDGPSGAGRGWELFASDGTPEGTGLVADLSPASPSGPFLGSFPGDFTPISDARMVFQADGDADGDTELWVVEVNDGPTAVDDEFTVDADTSTALDVRANDTDPNGDPLTITSVTQPPHGHTTTAGLQVVYTPDTGYLGNDTFSYTVDDGTGLTDTAIVLVHVAEEGSVPHAVDDVAATTPGRAVTIPVLANDSGDGIHVITITQPDHGRTQTGGFSVTYTPDAGFEGTDSFFYEIADADGDRDAATVRVTVEAPKEAPLVDEGDGTASATIPVADGEVHVQVDDVPDGSTVRVQVTTPGAFDVGVVAGIWLDITVRGPSGAIDVPAGVCLDGGLNTVELPAPHVLHVPTTMPRLPESLLNGDLDPDDVFPDPSDPAPGACGTVDSFSPFALGVLTLQRVSGPDRFATAATISGTGRTPGVDVAYVASGRNFPDALAGGPLAAATNGPILLTEPDSLPDATRTELTRLAPRRIVVLGGPVAIADTVADQLTTLTTGTVTRLQGTDRFATAAAISATTATPGVDVAYVASGRNFPDALAGGPLAAATNGPILLTEPDSLPDATRTELTRLAPRRIVVLGGPVAIADTVADQLRAVVD